MIELSENEIEWIKKEILITLDSTAKDRQREVFDFSVTRFRRHDYFFYEIATLEKLYKKLEVHDGKRDDKDNN